MRNRHQHGYTHAEIINVNLIMTRLQCLETREQFPHTGSISGEDLFLMSSPGQGFGKSAHVLIHEV